MTTNSLPISQMRWHCHRGMLELDLLLLPFIDEHYLNLSKLQQKLLASFLENSDPQLFAWLMGTEKPDDKELQDLVQLIRQSKV